MRKREVFGAVALGLGAIALGGWAYVKTLPGTQRVEFARAAEDCWDGGGDPGWRACLERASGGVNGDLVYHFHGRNQDERQWNDDSYINAMIQREWQARGVVPPTVVSVSWGKVWLLGPRRRAPIAVDRRQFVDEVMPAVERRLGATPRRRLLLGESMGGLNALFVALHDDGRFARAVSLCPPIYRIQPSAPWSEYREFLGRTGADPGAIWGVLGMARLLAGDDAEWADYAPLRILERLREILRADPARLAKLPSLYVSVGLYDKYGNYEGVTEFVRRAREAGLRVEDRPLYGGHCAVDVASVAAALVRP